ncbi:hypothetical protein PG995_008044 [Apiospora arundinis]|uniref:Uncharacterized protein n=1 Tax=Apiospora arundinis TaxID=335852 RepID=A0ABR2HZA4_9PEZI
MCSQPLSLRDDDGDGERPSPRALSHVYSNAKAKGPWCNAKMRKASFSSRKKAGWSVVRHVKSHQRATNATNDESPVLCCSEQLSVSESRLQI